MLLHFWQSLVLPAHKEHALLLHAMRPSTVVAVLSTAKHSPEQACLWLLGVS